MKQKDEASSTANKKSEKELIDPKKLSDEEFFDLCARVFEDKNKCGRCDECAASSECFIKEYTSCNIVVKYLAKELADRSKRRKPQKEEPLPKGTCKTCKFLQASMIEQGYHFCLAWHNFTVPDGYCYCFESEESSEE